MGNAGERSYIHQDVEKWKEEECIIFMYLESKGERDTMRDKKDFNQHEKLQYSSQCSCWSKNNFNTQTNIFPASYVSNDKDTKDIFRD